MQRRNYRGRDLHHEPSNDRVSDCYFVDIAPFQLSEEVLQVHSARLHEALVTAALYLDARDLKARATSKTSVDEGLTLALASQFSIHFREGNVVFEIVA